MREGNATKKYGERAWRIWGCVCYTGECVVKSVMAERGKREKKSVRGRVETKGGNLKSLGA